MTGKSFKPAPKGNIFRKMSSAVTGTGLMRVWLMALVLAAMTIFAAGCGTDSKNEAGEPVPEELAGQSFVYDELETGEGTALYTLRFTENKYYLYRDSGYGVLSSGTLETAADGSLTFHGKDSDFQGSYSGGVFQELSVEIEYDGRSLAMYPATDTSEYVYLSWLGVYEGTLEGNDAVLILERWYEYYLYSDGQLQRGTYEIFKDHTITFTPLEGDAFTGSVSAQDWENFDTNTVEISLNESGEDGAFTLAESEDSYDAEHAMGTYTLSVYKNQVFTIKGVDGYLKCMGVLEEEGDSGTAVYFPRTITAEVEKEDSFSIGYTVQDETLYFPETTPLLPRSGNIDEETGIGAYWNAGTRLEFIHTEEARVSLSEGIEFVDEIIEGAVSGGNLPTGVEDLKQVMPSQGTARPLVILVDFPDYHRPRHVTAQSIEEELFSLDNENSLAAYYYRASYGQLIIDGTVLGWYRTEQDRGEYASDKEIMAEALNYYIDQGIDLKDYDGDGNGEVDSLYILWAGTLSAEGGSWDAAYRSTWDQSPAQWDCAVTGYIFVPGTTVWSLVPPLVCNTNSLIHETGHLLGLNDYYSYDTGSRSEYSSEDGSFTGGALEGGMAGMDMMDANIGDHNAFSKWLMGWLEPTVIEYGEIQALDGQTYELRASSMAGDALFIQLKDAENLYTELLVIEAVAPVGNAAEYTRLQGPVVRILHVDASVAEEGTSGGWRGFGFAYDNSYTSTKFISVIEADGEDEFLNYVPVEGENKPSYSEADYFKEGDVIGPDTYPNTNGYDSLGNATVSTGLQVEIIEISEDGTATVRLSYQEPKETLTVIDISPQPRAVPYRTGEENTVPAGTSEIVFTYDQPIAADEEDLAKIRVISDQQDVEGVNIYIRDSQLVIELAEGVKSGYSYTVLIPQGILEAVGNEEIINNSNGIYGFAG